MTRRPKPKRFSVSAEEREILAPEIQTFQIAVREAELARQRLGRLALAFRRGATLDLDTMEWVEAPDDE
jgi:hypothetical protein